mgnify:CR=1 FL=1
MAKEKINVTNLLYYTIAKRVLNAKEKDALIIFMMGAHVIKSGVQQYLIYLMENGYFTLIALNGRVLFMILHLHL